MSALKLLFYYYADEFAKNTGIIAWSLQILTEKIDEFINENGVYDVEKHIKSWHENN